MKLMKQRGPRLKKNNLILEEVPKLLAVVRPNRAELRVIQDYKTIRLQSQNTTDSKALFPKITTKLRETKLSSLKVTKKGIQLGHQLNLKVFLKKIAAILRQTLSP